ncbi:MAG: response regulator [Candidatus Omnitrophica bacterium]|nr:response regulator [Candidatus Omnitrophota bacterium]
MVDDDQPLLESCKELLTQRGFSVEICSESTRAIPLLKEGSYDAVLLDIRMPGIEGTDLLPLMKKVCPDLPVIIASGYCDETSRSYCLSLGAFEVLNKPFTPERLLDAIGRAVERQERIPFVLTNLSLREGRDTLYRKLILSALRKTNWNQVKAATLLGISRYCLMRWIRKLEISY